MTPNDSLRIFYGGTFDPVHDGHVAVACAARDACDADVRFVPAGDPAHRALPGAGAPDRAAMVALAIARIPGLCIDLREVERGGRTWTVDTLAGLRSEFGPQAPLAWLVGADSFRGLPSWKRWGELLGLAHFIVAERPGSPLDASLAPELDTALAGRLTDDPAPLHQQPHGRVLRLRQPLQAHSATDLRQRIAAGLPWRGLVAPAVADYIVAHQLYGTRGA
ncbi:nicotinate-nucleotide adenylyltransferase [Cognatiluteimonas telluris]|uniref:nicotinate-nucleotide adenylyltransferase n=1 Tax=Cognatiluteimonas telluris TaxID=1104775 RepID=UPI00140B0736|nr:nicotinate-nucleotide adenylyltransferase [Lysobacter telluris]